MDSEMNEKKNSAENTKKNVSYSFVNPLIPQTGAKRKGPPPIGPEIGPDPRSSIGARISMAELPLMESESGIRFDFAFGYRVKFPADNREYKLRVYDLDSGMPLEEHMQMYTDKGMSRKEAMKQVAADRGVSKRDIYQALLED